MIQLYLVYATFDKSISSQAVSNRFTGAIQKNWARNLIISNFELKVRGGSNSGYMRYVSIRIGVKKYFSN